VQISSPCHTVTLCALSIAWIMTNMAHGIPQDVGEEKKVFSENRLKLLLMKN